MDIGMELETIETENPPTTSEDYQQPPTKEYKCTNCCSLCVFIVFFVTSILFIVLAVQKDGNDRKSMLILLHNSNFFPQHDQKSSENSQNLDSKDAEQKHGKDTETIIKKQYDQMSLWNLEDLGSTGAFFFSAITTLIINWIFMYFIRYTTFCCVWIINAGLLLSALGVAGFLLLSDNREWYRFGAIGASLAAIVFITSFCSRISMVINVLRESMRVMSKFWILKLLPLLTLLLISFMAKIFYILLGMNYSSDINENLILILLIFITFVLSCLFLLECQNYIVTGVITEWFFTEDENSIKQCVAIKSTFYNLLRYNLGSVCFGAFTIAEIFALKGTILILKKFNKNIVFKVINFALKFVNNTLKCIARSSYVLVSRDSIPFMQSGRIISNFEDKEYTNIIAMRWYAYVIIISINLLVLDVLCSTVLVSMNIEDFDNGMDHSDQRLVVWVGFAVASIYFCIVSVLEVVTDTILVCINLHHNEIKNTENSLKRINKHVEKLVSDFTEIKKKKKTKDAEAGQVDNKEANQAENIEGIKQPITT